MMKRIKIRSDDPSIKNGKVLRFVASIDFDALIEKIAKKLGLKIDPDKNIQDQFELRLQGGNLLEASDEIDSGDDVHLVSKNRQKQANPKVKSEQEEGSNNSECDDDSSVEDATEQVKEERRKNIVQPEVVDLLSDEDEEENDEEEDDEDDGDGSVEEGSDAWDDEKEDPASSEEENENDSDFDEKADDRKVTAATIASRRKKSKPPPEPPLRVEMDEKDMPSAPGRPDDIKEDIPNNNDLEEVSTLVDGAGRKKADRATKDRIIKLLNTGFHDQSNEHEAKNAMKLAQRLMQKHNLSQALLLKERQEKNDKEQNGGPDDDDEILKGGIVKVRIVNRKTGKPALFARWLSHLTSPITENFDVKCYHEVVRGRKCTVAFYGIYTNAQLAAYAFRVATERISQMATVYTPKKQVFAWQKISTKSSRLSYAIGIVEGISEDVQKNIKFEKLRHERKLSRARIAVSQGEAYDESDDEDDDTFDDNNDNEGTGFAFANGQVRAAAKAASKVSTVPGGMDTDSDDNGDSGKDDSTEDEIGKQKATPKSEQKAGRRLEELEQEQQAAIVLVDHREKIAEQVLDDVGIKLSKGRKRKAITFDRRSYNQGVEDAKEIDINQRSIKDEVKIKKEEGKKRKR